MEYNYIKNWQRLLSYLIGIPIETKTSLWSENISLILKNNSIELSTENAVYSYGKYYYAFSEAFKKLNIKEYAIKDVLILGLGMGSIIEILEEYFEHLSFTGVEKDSAVIELFKKYIVPKKTFNINICEEDAYEFVKDKKKRFDLINIDIFINDVIPHPFHDISFLENTKKILTKNGIVLFNRLDTKASYRKYNKEYWDTKFLNVFPKSQSLKIKGNLILVGHNE